MSDNIHEKLGRVRKPRVHITYDVETSGEQQLRELPFVVGVLGDYSGDNSAARKPLKDRRFINIDRDNFNETMARITPALNFRVDDMISVNAGKQFDINLQFHSLEDFEPENLVRQIAPLNALLDARNKLRDLMTKVDRSEQLETLLEQILQNSDELAALAQQLDIATEA
jgi:type VI secretion system protein ImpB